MFTQQISPSLFIPTYFWENIKLKCTTKTLAILILVLLLNQLNAQVKNNGIIYIGDKGIFHIGSGIFNFGLGNITTTRTNPDHGVFAFSSDALWEEATTLNHVDGYVESSFDFIFPTGQAGIYAPIQVTSSATEKIKAAYTRANPSQLNTTVNPAEANVTHLEFWDINGINSANTISLTWRNSSNISHLTNAQLTDLTIVGWNGKSWVEIPSQIDTTSILGEISSLESGSITSIPNFNLADYSVFTFGKKETQPVPIQFAIYVFQNNLYIDSSLPIDSLIVYTLWGQKLFEKKIAPTEHYYTPFFHSQAVYVAIVSFENNSRPELTTKIMNNL
jgi:hypothetical protein